MASIDEDLKINELGESPPSIPTIDDVFAAAKSLAPDDRLHLIAWLWETLPPEHWAAPSVTELTGIKRRVGEYVSEPMIERPLGLLYRLFAAPEPGDPKLYSAPRRFDLAMIFVVTAFYSLLFTLMTVLQFAPHTQVVNGTLITVVGIGQALLVPRFNPRAVSILVGAVFYTFALMILSLSDAPFYPEPFAAVVFFGLILGSLFGYLAGALVGGVFLVADLVRQKFMQQKLDAAAQQTSDAEQ